MKASGLRLYWETVRHLRPVQLYGRLWFRAVRPRARHAPAPPLRLITRSWVQPAQRPPSMLSPETLRFLNETRSLRNGWDDPGATKLWRYNLHYFDDLNAGGSPRRSDWHQRLLTRWTTEHLPESGGTGWEPYPTSLRIVNWIKWARAGNNLASILLDSLALQARWLARRLEYHLLGNHLWANAKALVFVGCFFEGPEADAWLERGLAILARELPEQILDDGGHFELSPMYHALVLEDLLDLINMVRSTGRSVPESWHNTIGAMREWLAALCHPDGEIAFFNDAAIGVAPSPVELQLYAKRLGYPVMAAPEPFHHFKESGYLRLASSDVVALIDAAPIGPDYLPGHGHADTLSFELSVKGLRCLVNSGTSVYGLGSERLRQRGTGAHNTVVIDEQNSSEVWSGFRVARRARPLGLRIEHADGEWSATCAHDGYRWLPGAPRHQRTWRLTSGEFTVCDTVSGAYRRSVAAFHFHPDLQPVSFDNCGELARSGTIALRWRVAKGRGWVEPTTWHPEFGLSLPTNRLLVELIDGASEVAFSWN